MKFRLTVFSISAALMLGALYLGNRTVPDRHVFAQNTSSSATPSPAASDQPASEAATPTPSPASTPEEATPRHHDHDWQTVARRQDDDDDDAVTPAVTPAPSSTPWMTPAPTPYAGRCGTCGGWPGSGPRPMYVCPECANY